MMSAENGGGWPGTTLDGVARVRLLAAMVPNAQLVERVLAAPYATVWEYLADVETSVPAFDQEVRRLTITTRRRDESETRLEMRVRARFTPPLRFTGNIGEGHLVMRGPANLYVVAIGVRPIDAERTLYVQFEGVPRRGGQFANRHIRRHVALDATALQRIVERLG